jgi:hypothetical protein
MRDIKINGHPIFLSRYFSVSCSGLVAALPRWDSLRLCVKSSQPARRTQVAKDLGHLFVRQGLGCFQLDDEAVIHEQVGAVVANERAVLENALTD